MDKRLVKYERNFTWSHPLGGEVIAHQDGAVSLMIEWDGLDAEMLTEQERGLQWLSFYRALQSLGTDCTAEFHWWREHDHRLALAYLEKGQDMVRGGEIAVAVRQAQADHLAQYAMCNSVAVVLTQHPRKHWFTGARRALKHQAIAAAALRDSARALTKYLAGGQMVSHERYAARIQQSLSRAAHLRGATVRHDPNFLLSEQLIREAPVVVNKAVTLGGQVTKVLLVYLYPDSHPGWFLGLASVPAALHVSHIVRRVDTKSAMQRAERESDLLEGTLSRRGRDYSEKGMSDLAAFRTLVAEHNLQIFHNAFIVHVHGTHQAVNDTSEQITDWIEKGGGQVRDADYIQLPYFRAAQPGQGYRVPMLRPDHTWQVGDMLPVQVYRTGDSVPESLRLGQAGQLIGFGLSNQPVSHSFTVAMTGSGKGVDKVATIAETFPFGIDWYIAEVGNSYQWVVEAFGGTYTRIDPDKNVVNPLPPFAVADMHADMPLDAKLAGGTIQALSFLLTDGSTKLDVHSRSAAQMVLQMLYARPDAARNAPTLPDYFNEMHRADYFDNTQQREAAKRMAENLHSFLSTTEGRLFTRQDNLTLSSGITGVDLKEVGQASEQLLKFYLVFISLRMAQMAFYQSRNPARILLDEMHEFVRVFPEVTGALISGIARMGRKENAAIDLVTQGIKEIDVIETEVLNSMPLRSLMYRSDEWDAIAARINMPAGPLEAWRRFPYPMNLPWRPALRSVGPEYYHLHLTFPDLILDLAATSPDDLMLKEAIAPMVRDPLERLQQFRATRERRQAA
ncbi:MAG: Uncharacterized protein FD165_2671 [Gammaproteobacteria bacterium]|nr:MAG: Uncharacterized protein FD165_2671 [Gammaproteobacteria bacterium]TND01144.1 MAG: Uncharacterized protein FD120_2680 [Gammaproteobacteria bacterium]